MDEDFVVLGIFSFVLFVALSLIFAPFITSAFSTVGESVKSVLDDNPLKSGSLIPFEVSRVVVNSIVKGPQDRFYVGQNFNLEFDLNITGSPENIIIEITDCPLQGNLKANVEFLPVIFDVFPTKTGLHSCYANISYFNIDGEHSFREQFTLPVYTGESQGSILWLVLILICLLIIIHLLKHDFKK